MRTAPLNVESRAERRRIEREMAKGVTLTDGQRSRLRTFRARHHGLLRRHFARFPADVVALERESDVAQLRMRK